MNGADDLDDERGLPESLTGRILALGLGAYFMTEDAVRRYVKDAKIPRDIARSITQNATKGKDELYGFVARELSTFLRQMDIQEEMHRFVGKHKIRISAEVEFVPRPGTEDESGPAPAGEETPSREGPVEWDVKFKMPARPSEAPEDRSSESEGRVPGAPPPPPPQGKKG